MTNATPHPASMVGSVRFFRMHRIRREVADVRDQEIAYHHVEVCHSLATYESAINQAVHARVEAFDHRSVNFRFSRTEPLLRPTVKAREVAHVCAKQVTALKEPS